MTCSSRLLTGALCGVVLVGAGGCRQWDALWKPRPPAVAKEPPKKGLGLHVMGGTPVGTLRVAGQLPRASGTVLPGTPSSKPAPGSPSTRTVEKPKPPTPARPSSPATPRDYSRFSQNIIPPLQLSRAIVVAWTTGGRLVRFSTSRSKNDLVVSHFAYVPLGTRGIPATRRQSWSGRVADGAMFDLDFDVRDGRVVRREMDRDFRWIATGPHPGLRPLNGAQFRVAVDFRGITYEEVRAAPMSIATIPSHRLKDAVLVVRTDEGRYAKLLVQSPDRHRLMIDELWTWNSGGRGLAAVKQGIVLWLKERRLLDFHAIDLDTATVNLVESRDLRFMYTPPRGMQSELRPLNGATAAIYRTVNLAEESSQIKSRTGRRSSRSIGPSK